jgi:hypothetical protein
MLAFADHQRSMREHQAKNAQRIKQQRRAARKKQNAEDLKQTFFEDLKQSRLERVFSMKTRSITPSSTRSNDSRPMGWTQSQKAYSMELTKSRRRNTSHGQAQDNGQSLDDKASQFIKRVYAPEWQIRQAAQMQSQKLERQTMLHRELHSIPSHQLEIMDNHPNYPWNNYPYRPDPITGYSKWPIQGMQGSRTPIRNPPFATAELYDQRWKTMKDEMYDPKRDGRCKPAVSTKDICSPYA